jgi:hypothetical protein
MFDTPVPRPEILAGQSAGVDEASHAVATVVPVAVFSQYRVALPDFDRENITILLPPLAFAPVAVFGADAPFL